MSRRRHAPYDPCPCGGRRMVYFSAPSHWAGVRVRMRRLRCEDCGKLSVAWEMDDAALATLQERGIVLLEPGFRAQHEECKAEAIILAREGYTFPAIARRLGITRQHVGSIVRQAETQQQSVEF